MRTKLEYLLFRSMWETYLCVHFQSRYGRLKLFQSFWYTLYVTNGSKTAVMDVIGFLRVSLGSSTVQLRDNLVSRRVFSNSEAGFSNENANRP
jgi:hypothetical protein